MGKHNINKIAGGSYKKLKFNSGLSMATQWASVCEGGDIKPTTVLYLWKTCKLKIGNFQYDDNNNIGKQVLRVYSSIYRLMLHQLTNILTVTVNRFSAGIIYTIIICHHFSLLASTLLILTNGVKHKARLCFRVGFLVICIFTNVLSDF